MSTISLLNGGQWLPFYLPLAKAFKSNDAAIFLSKLINKHEYHKSKDELTEDGYFFATIESIEEDINLSRYQQPKFIAQFEALGFIKTKLAGVPAKRFFKIEEDQLASFLQSGCPADFIREKLANQLARNSQTGKLKTSKLDSEKLATNYNTVIITHSTSLNNENTKGDFSEKTENEEFDLKAKKPKKETRAGGGDGEATLSPDLKRLETGKAVLTNASAKKAAKNDFRPVSVEISEALEDFGMLEVWERWRIYRWRMHKFQYFDDKSEKNALNSLMQKARNQSDVAIELVELAISNGWKGFYLPKTTVQNGQQAHQTGIKSTERIKSEFILDFNQRYGRQPNEDELSMAGAIYEGAIRG